LYTLTPKNLYSYRIYKVYPKMKKVKLISQNKLVLSDIEGFLKRKVTSFGNSAKVSCPKEYLNRTVYLVVVKE